MRIGFALIPSSPYFEEIIRIENELHEEANFRSKLGSEEKQGFTLDKNL